jgi:hypothetical protein
VWPSKSSGFLSPLLPFTSHVFSYKWRSYQKSFFPEKVSTIKTVWVSPSLSLSLSLSLSHSLSLSLSLLTQVSQAAKECRRICLLVFSLLSEEQCHWQSWHIFLEKTVLFYRVFFSKQVNSKWRKKLEKALYRKSCCSSTAYMFRLFFIFLFTHRFPSSASLFRPAVAAARQIRIGQSCSKTFRVNKCRDSYFSPRFGQSFFPNLQSDHKGKRGRKVNSTIVTHDNPDEYFELLFFRPRRCVNLDKRWVLSDSFVFAHSFLEFQICPWDRIPQFFYKYFNFFFISSIYIHCKFLLTLPGNHLTLQEILSNYEAMHQFFLIPSNLGKHLKKVINTWNEILRQSC